MLTKEKVLEMIKAIPDGSFADIDILLENLIVLEKIDRGLNDVKEGNVISEEEAKKEIDSWFK